MCEAYRDQYGCNFISVMPTNLYGPNDNFDLEKTLENNDWKTIQEDLNKLPIEEVTGKSNKREIQQILQKYGIKRLKTDVILSASPTKSFRRGVEGQNSEIKIQIEIWGSGKPKQECAGSYPLITI